MHKNTNLTSSEIKPIGLKNNVLVQELEKELLLYDLSRDKVFCLNETSMLIWNLCNGERSIEDIRREVSRQLNSEVNEELIWLALDKLKTEQLLSNHQEIEIKFNALSRREVIKKVGLSSMATLPLILTIVSPNAAAAQSQSCSSSTACFCEDATCLNLGDPALIMSPCLNTNCSNGGGVNCLCVGPFICSNTPGLRLGRCGLV